MYYETADTNRNNRELQALLEEMRNLPADVVSVEDDFGKRTCTYVYKNGRRETRSLDSVLYAKPSAKPIAGRSSTAAEVNASLRKTMREADQNISDFIRRIAQLDVEISRSIMRGQYIGDLKSKRDDLFQRINKLEAIKKRCAALLCGA